MRACCTKVCSILFLESALARYLVFDDLFAFPVIVGVVYIYLYLILFLENLPDFWEEGGDCWWSRSKWWSPAVDCQAQLGGVISFFKNGDFESIFEFSYGIGGP